MSMNISVHRVNEVMVLTVVFSWFCLLNILFEEKSSHKTQFYLKQNDCQKYFFVLGLNKFSPSLIKADGFGKNPPLNCGDVT